MAVAVIDRLRDVALGGTATPKPNHLQLRCASMSSAYGLASGGNQYTDKNPNDSRYRSSQLIHELGSEAAHPLAFGGTEARVLIDKIVVLEYPIHNCFAAPGALHMEAVALHIGGAESG
jgi:hypothetical protein